MGAAIDWGAVDDWAERIPYWITQTLTAEEWEALPEDICRRIEVVDGYVIFLQAPARAQQKTGSRLWNLLYEAATEFAARTGAVY